MEFQHISLVEPGKIWTNGFQGVGLVVVVLIIILQDLQTLYQ